MIAYRKASQLRMRRAAAPEPPFWCATTIAPYSSRRGAPIAIDYLDLRASSADKLDVAVCDRVTAELERGPSLHEPVLIEATEFAEQVFRRGDEALAFCRHDARPALHLISTRSALPESATAETTRDATIAIAAWPLDFDDLGRLFAEAQERRLRWGVAVPVIFPVTTDLEALAQLCELTTRHEAEFLAAIAVEVDPTAKQSMASSLAPDGDDETYDALFHADLEPVHVATERHIAALASEAGMSDFIVPPRFEEPSNWNAAIILTLTATRMLAMSHDVELAGTLARSARAVAELDKPIARVAEAASLAIVEALDEASVDILTEWLARGQSSFVERVNRDFRLRRDYRVEG
ncbi:MAG: hypothetical protein JWM82_3249 [Myxococcales bacterium]|nr:hypothetical protein [Myxococcales bacterium]